MNVRFERGTECGVDRFIIVCVAAAVFCFREAETDGRDAAEPVFGVGLEKDVLTLWIKVDSREDLCLLEPDIFQSLVDGGDRGGSSAGADTDDRNVVLSFGLGRFLRQ